MNYLLLIALIIFIISIYLFFKYNNSASIEIQSKQAIRVNLITTSFLVIILAYPIFQKENTNGRINFMQKKIENETHKWDKGNFHSLIPKLRFDSIIDTIITSHTKYINRNLSRDSFDIVCFDIMYNEQLTAKFVNYLEVRNDIKRINILNNHFKGDNTASLPDKLARIKENLEGKINKSFAIVHKDTLIKDTLHVIGKIGPVYTQYDFGNLCPPECDGFTKDSLFIIFSEAIKDQNTSLIKPNTPEWNNYKRIYKVKNFNIDIKK